MMDMTTLVIGYLLISAFCTSALVSACVISGRTKDVGKRIVRAAYPQHHMSVLALNTHTR
jgi:hypothetical protein